MSTTYLKTPWGAVVRQTPDTQAYGWAPVVVIDPEDREQVERLTGHLADAMHDWPEPRAMSPGILADALREFADPKPPKPDEPQGLGAVVEDAEGQRWVRATNFTTVRHWRGCDEHWQGRRRWDEITAVKVLNEGVS